MKGGHGRRLMLYAGSSWARIVAGFAVSFILTPMLIEELGVDLFGLLSLVALTLALSDPIKAAVGKVLTRELTQARAAEDRDRFRDVFSNGVVLAILGAAIVMLIASVLAIVGPEVLRLAPENVSRARVALFIEGAMFASVLLLMPANNLYIATHRIVLENVHRSLIRVLDLIAALIVFSVDFGDPFLSFVIGRAILRSAHGALKASWILLKEPWARFHSAMVLRTRMKDLAGIGAWSMGTQIARIGFVACDQILLNMFFGLVYNGLYGVVNQLRSYARMFGGNIALGVDAVAADLDERGDDAKGRALLIATMKMTLSVTLHCAILIGVFTPVILEVWLGDRLYGDENLLSVMTPGAARDLAWSFILILLPGIVLMETNRAATENLYGMGHIRRYSPLLIWGAVIKIVLATSWLMLGGGPLSLAWSSLLVNALVYGIALPRLVCVLTTLTARELIFGAYLRPLVASMFIAAAAVGMYQLFEDWDWTTLILSVGATCAVYAVTFPLIVTTASERASIWRMITGIARRGNGRRATKA